MKKIFLILVIGLNFASSGAFGWGVVIQEVSYTLDEIESFEFSGCIKIAETSDGAGLYVDYDTFINPGLLGELLEVGAGVDDIVQSDPTNSIWLGCCYGLCEITTVGGGGSGGGSGQCSIKRREIHELL